MQFDRLVWGSDNIFGEFLANTFLCRSEIFFFLIHIPNFQNSVRCLPMWHDITKGPMAFGVHQTQAWVNYSFKDLINFIFNTKLVRLADFKLFSQAWASPSSWSRCMWDSTTTSSSPGLCFTSSPLSPVNCPGSTVTTPGTVPIARTSMTPCSTTRTRPRQHWSTLSMSKWSKILS